MLNEGDTDSFAVFRDLSKRQKDNTSAAQVGRSHTNVLASALKCKYNIAIR